MTDRQITIPIDLASLFESLRGPLDLIDNPERRADLERLLQVAKPSLDRAAFQMLSSIAREISGSDAGLKARIELQPDGARLVLELAADAPEDCGSFFEGDLERVTLRLPAELKEMIDRLANLQGDSANSVYIRELARTISRNARDRVRVEIRKVRSEAQEQQHRSNRRGSRFRGSATDE